MLISSSSSDFSVFLVSFYIPIKVPKFTTSLLLDLENIDQTTLSQPVDDLQDHSGLSVNLVERKAQPRRAGKSDTDGEELRIGIAADTEFHPLSLILRL